ncbi:hypothetical protein AB0C98_38120 [Streptomyces sp. NPDC048558]|uniref:hypothetical protein n=1 Tax=Streptomyces sp. NPDC048558 TaxID=3155759 RepID=UPI003423F34F
MSRVESRVTEAESGSLGAAFAASRFACAVLRRDWPYFVSRGMDAWTFAIVPAASSSHFAAPALYSASRSVAFARSPLQLRNSSAPSPFQLTHCGRVFSSSPAFWTSAATFLSLAAAATTAEASA